MTGFSLCLPSKDSERLMEQQGALLKRLAEADSEKAVRSTLACCAGWLAPELEVLHAGQRAGVLLGHSFGS